MSDIERLPQPTTINLLVIVVAPTPPKRDALAAAGVVVAVLGLVLRIVEFLSRR